MSIKLADILREYGQAIRGDWSSIDGRDIKAGLDYLADTLGIEGNKEYTSIEAKELRSVLYICLSGGGHWEDYCDEECNKEE